MILPSSITATLLAISLIACISWVIKTIVRPNSWFNFFNKARISGLLSVDQGQTLPHQKLEFQDH